MLEWSCNCGSKTCLTWVLDNFLTYTMHELINVLDDEALCNHHLCGKL